MQMVHGWVNRITRFNNLKKLGSMRKSNANSELLEEIKVAAMGVLIMVVGITMIWLASV